MGVSVGEEGYTSVLDEEAGPRGDRGGSGPCSQAATAPWFLVRWLEEAVGYRWHQKGQGSGHDMSSVAMRSCEVLRLAPASGAA